MGHSKYWNNGLVCAEGASACGGDYLSGSGYTPRSLAPDLFVSFASPVFIPHSSFNSTIACADHLGLDLVAEMSDMCDDFSPSSEIISYRGCRFGNRSFFDVSFYFV